MPHLDIHVTGKGSTIHKAERGVLVLQAQSKRVSTAQEASSIVTATTNEVRDIISPHCSQDGATSQANSDAAISHYSMSTLDTSMHEQRREVLAGQKLQYDTTYSAKAEFHIKFSNFSVLDTLATQFSTMENIRIQPVDWRLTDKTLNAITSDARKSAAHDAIRRARDYAEVFAGLSTDEAVAKVKAIHIEEQNYYSTSTKPQLHYGKMQRNKPRQKSELQFQPEDVRLEVKVTGKFVVE